MLTISSCCGHSADIMLSLMLVLMVTVVQTIAQEEETCYADNRNPYLYYGTKTAYEFVYEKKPVSSIPSCTPVQVWTVVRHGTRYPAASVITKLRTLEDTRNQIIYNHEQRKNGELCDKDLENLKRWSINITEDSSDTLAPQGHEDLFLLARRIKTDFPDLLSWTYSQDRYKFRHTDTQRSQASCASFIKGLFGSDASDVYVPPPVPNDQMLCPYSNCTVWENTIAELTQEKKRFQETALMKNVIHNVSHRLGFLYNLTMETVSKIYDMCRYNKAFNFTNVSPWCAAFTKNELQILEYNQDIFYYYKSGYGADINLRLGCPLVKNLIERFSKLENSTTGQPSGIFYFAHGAQVNMLSSRLGFNKDSQPLTYENYNVMTKRKFRSSLVLPFTANIMAVFYKCTMGEENQVMFYQNERVVDYEGCNVGLCSWKYIKAKFADIIKPETCNVDFCKDNKNTASTLQQSYFWLVMLTVLVLNYFH